MFVGVLVTPLKFPSVLGYILFYFAINDRLVAQHRKRLVDFGIFKKSERYLILKNQCQNSTSFSMFKK